MPGGNPALNTAVAVRLRGRLDLPALERAFAALAERHEALRTTFQYENGELCQLIAPTLALRVVAVDVRDFPEAERAGVPAHLEAAEVARPFDLARGPLCRARLVRVGFDEHTLLFTLHHIVCDGWSNGVLLRELAALYAAFSQGKPSPLAALPLQFADFAQWQQDRAAAGGFDADLAYWREKLAGALPVLDLPASRPRTVASRIRVAAAGTVWRRLPDGLTATLKSLAVREGVSAYMLYLAAFTVLLSRYDANGGEDVLVGTPSANRGRAEIGGRGWPVRQPAAAPHGPIRRPDFPRTPRPRPPDRARCVRARGGTLRAVDRRTAIAPAPGQFSLWKRVSPARGNRRNSNGCRKTPPAAARCTSGTPA